MPIDAMSREELLEIVRKLPQTNDGVPITPEMRLFNIWGHEVEMVLCEAIAPFSRRLVNHDAAPVFSHLFSSSEAAANARVLRGFSDVTLTPR